MTDDEFNKWVAAVSSGETVAMPPGKPRRREVQHEAMEQAALFEWVRRVETQLPELKLLYHVPNGGSRNKYEAANLKRQGVKAGVPDLCLPVARGEFHGLYIELKAGKNTASEKQNEWLVALRKQGYAAEVCVGWEQAQRLLEKYLRMRGTNNDTRT